MTNTKKGYQTKILGFSGYDHEHLMLHKLGNQDFTNPILLADICELGKEILPAPYFRSDWDWKNLRNSPGTNGLILVPKAGSTSC